MTITSDHHKPYVVLLFSLIPSVVYRDFINLINKWNFHWSYIEIQQKTEAKEIKEKRKKWKRCKNCRFCCQAKCHSMVNFHAYAYAHATCSFCNGWWNIITFTHDFMWISWIKRRWRSQQWTRWRDKAHSAKINTLSERTEIWVA